MANEEFGADLITLVDDEGHEHEFEIVDTLELGETLADREAAQGGTDTTAEQ